MPRQRRLRKVVSPPKFKGYKPYGAREQKSPQEEELLYEEYEALKLADYDLMNHAEAATLMGVSRATFARIYESARRKLARAFVETKEIRMAYGNAEMDQDWYICNNCYARFTIPEQVPNDRCPLCNAENIVSVKS
ncbi:DUF134 domain-containing protein [Halosquirtibacter xylanolyticus]|uniref:DUF134 domain-containing protein n=1 Tax=Halosquirtibacter xylanolyticus TaxID=3374599 RepID=UPI0037481C19|nr:DUF134 domain-containing protein [Prolixibacteraceae bacterium]